MVIEGGLVLAVEDDIDLVVPRSVSRAMKNRPSYLRIDDEVFRFRFKPRNS